MKRREKQKNRPTLVHYSSCWQEERAVGTPEVGVFFLVGDHIYIDSTPITSACVYGECLTHEPGHPGFWERLQEEGSVPKDDEYDEYPRGRITWNSRVGEAYLFVDRCIKTRPQAVEQIMDRMHLPSATLVRLDSHYRCPNCRRLSDE